MLAANQAVEVTEELNHSLRIPPFRANRPLILPKIPITSQPCLQLLTSNSQPQLNKQMTHTEILHYLAPVRHVTGVVLRLVVEMTCLPLRNLRELALLMNQSNLLNNNKCQADHRKILFPMAYSQPVTLMPHSKKVVPPSRTSSTTSSMTMMMRHLLITQLSSHLLV